MSAFPMVMQGVGSVMQAVSTIQSGNSQASVEGANANIASLQAQQVRKSGEYEVAKLKRSKKQAISTQRALYAKSGVLISEGSPIEVMADTATQFEMDIQAQQYNTAIEAAKYDYEAEYRKAMARQYKQTGRTKAASQILLSLGKIAGSYGGGTTGKT